MNLVNRDSIVLVSLIALFALVILLHVFLCLKSLRASGVPKLLRYFTWLPPLACVASFWSGARVMPVLWCIVLVAYLVLRSQA
jgi:hypothetical protein